MPPVSPNPLVVLDQTKPFPYPFFRCDLYNPYPFSDLITFIRFRGFLHVKTLRNFRPKMLKNHILGMQGSTSPPRADISIE